MIDTLCRWMLDFNGPFWPVVLLIGLVIGVGYALFDNYMIEKYGDDE